MFSDLLSVINVVGETFLKLVPVSVALGIGFAVLTHWSACNPAMPGGASARSSPTSATGS